MVLLAVAAFGQEQHTWRPEPPGPKYQIHELVISGATAVPSDEQGSIVAQILEESKTEQGGLGTREIAEHLRDAWQRRGYFKAVVELRSRIIDRDARPPIADLEARVKEGPQYRLSHIAFHGPKAVSAEQLRPLFPIKDGDIFATGKLRKGLENLREAYGRLGYINFTAVPDTREDEQHRTIALVFDVDEGRQFWFRSLNVTGVSSTTALYLMEEWDTSLRGKPYDWDTLERFIGAHHPDIPTNYFVYRDTGVRKDEAHGQVDITLNIH